MWSFDRNRRIFLIASLAALASCRLQPAFAPQSEGSALIGGVVLPTATSADTQSLIDYLDARLGQAVDPKWTLSLMPKVSAQNLAGIDAQRIQLSGVLSFALTPIAPETKQVKSSVSGFVGYTAAQTTQSNTNFAISNRAAATDARDRLMVVLADRMIDRLVVELARVKQ